MTRACFLVAGLAAALIACKPAEDTNYKAIIGAVLIDPGSPLISRSVLVVAGPLIRALGEQASTPIPVGSDKVDGSGKFLIPAPVAIPADLPKVASLADVQTQIDNGAVALAGMIADTEELNQEFIQKLRDLHIVFVPKLSSPQGAPEAIAHARNNTKKLAEDGIMIAADNPADWKALAEAGLRPDQVLAAVTHNAARAAGKEADVGGLQPGYRASVWLLNANPLENVAALSNVDMTIDNGEWGHR